MTTESGKRGLSRVRQALRGDGDDPSSANSGPDGAGDEDAAERVFEDSLASASGFLTGHAIDAAYYLAVNEDIRRAGIDPLRHYLRFGMAEGRVFHPALSVESAEGSTGSAEDVSPVLRVGSSSFVLRIVDERRDLDAYLGPLHEEEEFRVASVRFREFLSGAGIDATYYLAAHPDIAHSGLDPVDHYLRHGILEGRLFHPRARMAVSPADRHQPQWEEADAVLRIGANAYRFFALPLLEAVDDAVVDLARDQWAHEPSLFAFGIPAVQHLHVVVAGNFPVRLEFEVTELLRLMDGSFGAVVVVADLESGDSVRQAGDLTWALTRLGMRTLVVRTDAPVGSVPGSGDGAGRGFGGDVVVADWDQLCRMNQASMLARLVNAVKPEVMVVVDAPTGFEAVVDFGVGLSAVTRLACVYDATGPSPGGGGTAARYAGLTAPYARTLTATRSAAGVLDDLWSPVATTAPAVLPQRVVTVDETVMQARLDDRLQRTGQRSGGRHWLWWAPPEVGPVDGRLERLAAARPADRFDVLARRGEDVPVPGHRSANVRTVGPDDLARSAAGADGIILAHPTAGSARVALEMSQYLVPLVLWDSEVFRDVLDPGAAVFAHPTATGDEPDVALSEALDILARMAPGEVGDLVSSAWSLVRERHSDDAYLLGLAGVLGLGDD